MKWYVRMEYVNAQSLILLDKSRRRGCKENEIACGYPIDEVEKRFAVSRVAAARKEP